MIAIIDGGRRWSDDDVAQIGVRLDVVDMIGEIDRVLERIGRVRRAVTIFGDSVTVDLVPLDEMPTLTGAALELAAETSP